MRGMIIMKKRFLALLLAGMTALSVTACGGKGTDDQKEVVELNTTPEDSTVESTVQTSEEGTEVQQGTYQVILETQEISYRTPTGNTELVNVSLKTRFLGNNEDPAIEKINKSFDTSYKDTRDLIEGDAVDGEGDFTCAVAYCNVVDICSCILIDKMLGNLCLGSSFNESCREVICGKGCADTYAVVNLYGHRNGLYAA